MKPRIRTKIKRTSVSIYKEPIKIIYKKFIRPMSGYFVGDNERDSFVRTVKGFFQLNTREVWFAESKGSFRMPGKIWNGERHNELVTDVVDRKVKAGDKLIVRIDLNMPDRCEIEFKDCIFVMPKAQYQVIREYIKFIV